MTYLVFVIQAYVSRLDTGRLEDVTTLEIIDKDYKSAEKRARKIIKKPFYRLARVIENFK